MNNNSPLPIRAFERVCGSTDVVDLDENATDTQAVTFDLYAIDLFLSKCISFGSIGDLYSFGSFNDFYALDKDTVVILDYNSMENALRQRIVTIDWNKNKAQCLIYRTYSVISDPTCVMIGKDWATANSKGESTLLFPTNPLNANPHRDISNYLSLQA
ncbi:hypothetical protein PENTCL1PPCAC_5701, partial [Pristionchus entomophagus]